MEWLLIILAVVFVIRLVWYKYDSRRLNADAAYMRRADNLSRSLLKYSQKFPRFDELTTTEIAEASLGTLIAVGEAKEWKVPRHCQHKHEAFLSFLNALTNQWDDVPNITDEEANRRMDQLRRVAEQCKAEMHRNVDLPRAKDRNVIQAFLLGYGR